MPKQAFEFLNLIVKTADNKWNLELNINDEKFAEIVGFSAKTIKRKRNNLKEYMKSSDGKAVVDIKPNYANGKHIGQTYSLNIFRSIENGIKNFISEDENYIPSISAFISQAETIKLQDINSQNNKFKQIFSSIQKELNKLSDKPKIIETLGEEIQKEQRRLARK